MDLRTDKKKECERRNTAIVADFWRLYSGTAMKSAVYERLARKYKLSREYIAYIINHANRDAHEE